HSPFSGRHQIWARQRPLPPRPSVSFAGGSAEQFSERSFPMLSTRLVRSLFGRVSLPARKVVRHRLEVMALESRWLPSTITEFLLPPLSLGGALGAQNIAVGPDGNLWSTDPVANDIGRIPPAGQVTEFPGLAGEGDITAGPDGNLWFTAGQFFDSSIGRITP